MFPANNRSPFFSRVRVGFIFWFHPSRDPFMNESANPTLTPPPPPQPPRMGGVTPPSLFHQWTMKATGGEGGGCAKNRYLTPLAGGGRRGGGERGGVSISPPWLFLPRPDDPRASTTWRVGMRGEMKRSKLFSLSLSLSPSFFGVGGILGFKKKPEKKSK